MKFFRDMPVGIAILTIITIFLAGWAIVIARHPKPWRLWWMTFFGIADLNSTREQRRQQEFYLSVFSYVVFSLLLAISAISAYWVVIQVQERNQPRSDYEQAKDKTLLDVEKMKARKQFRKL